jgi:hypothetical protein
LKIAFIVQRYGTEILGGSEYHCRLIAERLAPRHAVEVLTTCAADYITWKNEYPEGTDRVRGVTVRRFANAQTRDLDAFNRYSEWIFTSQHTRSDEMEWLRQQGPWCPALLEYLERNHQQFDVLVFLGTRRQCSACIAPEKRTAPTAHDEPAIRLEIYKEPFQRGGGTPTTPASSSSRRTSSIRATRKTVGCGVDLPQAHSAIGRDRSPDESLRLFHWRTMEPRRRHGRMGPSLRFRPHLAHRGSISGAATGSTHRSCPTADDRSRQRL